MMVCSQWVSKKCWSYCCLAQEGLQLEVQQCSVSSFLPVCASDAVWSLQQVSLLVFELLQTVDELGSFASSSVFPETSEVWLFTNRLLKICRSVFSANFEISLVKTTGMPTTAFCRLIFMKTSAVFPFLFSYPSPYSFVKSEFRLSKKFLSSFNFVTGMFSCAFLFLCFAVLSLCFERYGSHLVFSCFVWCFVLSITQPIVSNLSHCLCGSSLRPSFTFLFLSRPPWGLLKARCWLKSDFETLYRPKKVQLLSFWVVLCVSQSKQTTRSWNWGSTSISLDAQKALTLSPESSTPLIGTPGLGGFLGNSSVCMQPEAEARLSTECRSIFLSVSA